MGIAMNARKTAMALAAAQIAVYAGPPPAPQWENPAVNSVNRLPAATYAPPLERFDPAQTKIPATVDELKKTLEYPTPWTMSLDGDWKFRWTGDPARAVAGFEAEAFDDSQWAEIPVPACVEMHGYGIPIYTNIIYPHKKAWPRIFDRESGRADYNPVSMYRRRFALPAGWKGRDAILRFEGVGSAFYVWVNGKFAGYAEDSRLPSEFDITPFLKESGDNTLAVKVFRWCDGSYVEDQDMFRYSGVFRSVSVWSRPKAGIADFAATGRLAAEGGKAGFDVDVKLRGGAAACSATLYDASGKAVVAVRNAPADAGGRVRMKFDVPQARLWSAEDPYLYTLVLESGADIRAKRIGIKTQKVENRTVLVNGRPVKFHGVNRHECHPAKGCTVDLDDMLEDILLMKRNNIDTVRTSHYPDHRLWYDLCDIFGIYLIAEANVEAHEYGYGKDGLGRHKEWDWTIRERNERNVLNFRNSPSVVFWSLGNETGHGDGFRKAAAAVRAIDPARLVHWERGNEVGDVDSSMYPSVPWLETRGKDGDGGKAGKPYIMCEYAHAMGNALGNFEEYWKTIYAHPSLCGGCIWDWADQAIWKYTGRTDSKTGRPERYLAYGGDFDDSPNSGPFCDNGVVDPLRSVTPKLLEVGHVYRSLAVSRAADGSFELVNRNSFTSADAFSGIWMLIEDGREIASGTFALPPVAPLSKGALDLPGLVEACGRMKSGREYFVNFAFAANGAALWGGAGRVVARDQVAIPAPSSAGADAAANPAPKRLGGVYIRQSGDEINVEFGHSFATFSRKEGTLVRLVFPRNLNVLETPGGEICGGPRLTCARAFTDNDKHMVKPFFASGLSQLRHHPLSTTFTTNSVTVAVDVSGAKGCGFVHECEYVFSTDGSFEMRNRVKPYGAVPALPRLGLTMLLNPALEQMEYYGRGPQENYIDRCTGSFVGVYRSTVREQFVDYVRPQDCGGKTGVRWAVFANRRGEGVRFSSTAPMCMQALHYGWEDLEFARHRDGQRRYRAAPTPRDEIVLNLDVRQTGLGGASCGPGPLPQYTFDPSKPVEWTVKAEPVDGGKLR